MIADERRVERLARIMYSHECWNHPGWINPKSEFEIRRSLRFALETDERSGGAAYTILRAAILEIEDRTVFGTPERCAVCGQGPAARKGGFSSWLCGRPECVNPTGALFACLRVSHGDDAEIQTVIDARYLYRQSQSAGRTTSVEKEADMTDNRCPSCRWRVLHEQGSGRPQVPCCHGGSPVTIHGDFPFCPEPPYDFCSAFKEKEAPPRTRVGPPDGPGPEDCVPIYGCPVPPEKLVPALRKALGLDTVEGAMIPMYGAPMPPDQIPPELRATLDGKARR